MVRRVLIVAYHFPPILGSSGLQRTLKFATYLPEHGWEATVLTVHPMAYERTTGGQLSDIPENLHVCRTFALDAARHLAIFGKYPGVLGLPDRWASWWLSAVPAGRRLVRERDIDVVLSTFPIATAHLIGRSIRRGTGIPWVADFRDPMTDVSQPPDPRRRRVFERIEAETVRGADGVLVTTPGARDLFAARYPDVPAARYRVIRNGYDERNFRALVPAAGAGAGGAERGRRITLVHSGLLYREERDPRPFFRALGALGRGREPGEPALRVVLRATGDDRHFGRLVRESGLEDVVTLAPAVSYERALGEMLAADGLLLFQASSCNHQIPAKLYEYFRAGRPIFALTDPKGDTAAELRGMGLHDIVPIDREDAIREGLARFVDALRAGTASVPDRERVALHDRRHRTAELAEALDALVAARPATLTRAPPPAVDGPGTPSGSR